ncbi:MAG: alpha/beta hydrolase [bacterium]|nr:alpha/beta hydrolase [bacterium]
MAKISQSLEEKSLDLAGKRVHYLEAGKGPSLILIHGWCGSADFFTGIIPQLAEKFKIIAPDLPGCGLRGKEGSEELEGKHTIFTYVNFLRRLVKHLKLGKVNLLGYSMGGTITLEWAKKYPKEVSKIVVFEPNLGGRDISFLGKLMIIEGKIKFSRPLLRWVYAEVTEKEKSFRRLSSKNKKVLIDELYGASLRMAEESAEDILRGKNIESYQKIQSPTLLLAGGLKTPVSTPEEVEKLGKIIPGAKVVKFLHAGHAFIMEDPAGLTGIVVNFLELKGKENAGITRG